MGIHTQTRTKRKSLQVTENVEEIMARNSLHAGLRANVISSVQMSKLCQKHKKTNIAVRTSVVFSIGKCISLRFISKYKLGG